MNQDSKTIKGMTATGLGALLLLPVLLFSTLLSGCPSNSGPSSPNGSAPTNTPMPTATVTSTPIAGIYWQSAQFYRYENSSGNQATINLTVNGQASTTVLVTINGTGFAAPVTLPYSTATVAGGVTYATYYSTSSNLIYTAGGTVTLTTIAGSVTATGTVGEPGGNLTVNGSGTQVTWSYPGNAYDKVYVVQVPLSGIGVTIYTSPGTTPASPLNISPTYTNGYTYDIWTAIADGGIGYTSGAATGSSFVVYDTSETINTTYDFTNTPTLTGTPGPATSTFTPTSSPTPTVTSTPSNSPTVTPTPTITSTSTPAGLDITGSVTFYSGEYDYGYVHVHSGGGVLIIDEAVTLNLGSYLLVDAGATITGDGYGFSQGFGPGTPELVNEFSTPIPYTGSGAGHGGQGGPDGSGFDDGGSTNDTAQNPAFVGSGGGVGSLASGSGSGGGLFYALCPNGSITINGTLSMSGQAGANNTGSGQAGGGGAGGSILLQGNTIYGTGVVEANGGVGGTSNSGYGGGGGGGGRIEFVTPGGGTTNFTGTVGVNGGAGGGSTSSLPGTAGFSGSLNDSSSL